MNADRTDPGPLADVSYGPSGEQWTLVFVRDIPHPQAKVWAALTDPAQLGRWAPFEADRSLAETGAATLTMIDGETRMPLAATVTTAQPPTLLEYTWGEDHLRWELAATPTGTRLTLRHTLADRDFVPKVAAGWHLCLVVAGRLLDGDDVAPIRGQGARQHGWDELDEAYAAKLGLPAGEG